MEVKYEKPLLSVAIPTWNGAKTIKRTLEGVLSQEERDLEIIVGDDRSTDETLETVKAVRDPRIKVFGFRERAGITGNWTRTLRLCRGKYAVIVGQDDEVESGWASSLVSALEEHPEASLAFSRRRMVYDDEESKKVVGYFFSGKYPDMLKEFYSSIDEVIGPREMTREAMKHSFEINLIGEPAFVAFRRDHPAVKEGFDPGMTQMMDWEFYTRFFCEKPLVHVPKELGTFHIHVEGSSVAHARTLEKHYREYYHLLGAVIRRFYRFLSPDDISSLVARMEEAHTWISGSR